MIDSTVTECIEELDDVSQYLLEVRRVLKIIILKIPGAYACGI